MCESRIEWKQLVHFLEYFLHGGGLHNNLLKKKGCKPANGDAARLG